MSQVEDALKSLNESCGCANCKRDFATIRVRVATLEAALRDAEDALTFYKDWVGVERIRAALSPSSSAPADDGLAEPPSIEDAWEQGYARGIEDAASIAAKMAEGCLFPGASAQQRHQGKAAACLCERIRALAPPSPSSAAPREEP